MPSGKESSRDRVLPLASIATSFAGACLLIVLAACSEAGRSSGQTAELSGEWQWELPNGCRETLSFTDHAFRWKGKFDSAAGTIVDIKSFRNSQFKGITLNSERSISNSQTCAPSGFLPKLLSGQPAFYLLDPSRLQMLICEQPNVVMCAGPFYRLVNGIVPPPHDDSK